MKDDPRQVLFRLIRDYGVGLVNDPRRFEALLRDLCPQWDWKPRVLVDALKERVPQELTSSSSPPVALVKSEQLVRRLTDLALTEEAARWAVESWALAMGVVASPPPQPQPQPQPPPPPPQPQPQPQPQPPPPQPQRQPQPPRPRWWLWLGAIALVVVGLAIFTSLQSPPPSHVFKGSDGEWHPEDGYVWMASPHVPGDLRVRWTGGQPSNRYPHLETSQTEGRWRPADGYMWVNNPPSPGDFRVKWIPGRASNEYPNIISGQTEGEWHPAPGFTWLNPGDPKGYRVKPIEAPKPTPSPPPEAQKPETSAAFQQGLADRRTWEQ